jgi:hypothetical protein
MQGFQMVLHTLYGMLYVMTETVQVGKPPPFWHTTMLYVVDALQVKMGRVLRTQAAASTAVPAR